MNTQIAKDEIRLLEFAFSKFSPYRYPVLIDTRFYSSTHRNQFHNHEYPQVWYCLSGKYFHQVNDQVFECDKGSVIVLPPGAYHKFWIPEGQTPEIMSLNLMYDAFLNTAPEGYINTVSNLFLPSFAKELKYTFPLYYTLSPQSQVIFEETASWLALIHFDPANIALSKIYDHLETIFSLPEFSLPVKHHAKAISLFKNRIYPILHALSYMNSNYRNKITEEDILKEVAICRCDLCKYFKRFTGYACFSYLRWLRINHAIVYMTRTSYSLTYISDVCGFANLPHMSQIFTKATGTTPGEFRKGRKAHNTNKKLLMLVPLPGQTQAGQTF